MNTQETYDISFKNFIDLIVYINMYYFIAKSSLLLIVLTSMFGRSIHRVKNRSSF